MFTLPYVETRTRQTCPRAWKSTMLASNPLLARAPNDLMSTRFTHRERVSKLELLLHLQQTRGWRQALLFRCCNKARSQSGVLGHSIAQQQDLNAQSTFSPSMSQQDTLK